jgi:hypothetical protein
MFDLGTTAKPALQSAASDANTVMNTSDMTAPFPHANLYFDGMHKYLCERCQSFRLQVNDFIKHRGIEEPDRTNAPLDLGSRDEIIARLDSCSLCRLVAHSLDLYDPEIPRRPNVTHRLLRSTGSNDSEEIAERQDELALYLVPSIHSETSMEQMSTSRCRLMLCGDDLLARGARSAFSTARLPTPTQAHFGTIKQWVSRCSKMHRDCSESSLATTSSYASHNTLVVIDVQQRCLVNILASDRYFALSYVWGREATFQTLQSNVLDLRRSGGLDDVWAKLPKTITDSMELLVAIDECYLWCDRLCIVQDDPKTKHSLISRMDQIYGSAYAVIIARSGEHADVGLFGQHPWHKAEPIAEGMRLVAVPEFQANSLGVIPPLESRAWT